MPIGREQIPFVVAGTFLMALQPMLVMFSKNEEGKLEYSTESNVLISEFAKLMISCSFYLGDRSQPRSQFRFTEMLEYSIPGTIYFINNNLTFIILTYVDATTFQLLGQLKTVFTALLFRWFLGRELDYYQYLAIWQLACGCTVSQLHRHGTPRDNDAAVANTSLIGVMLACFSCLLSALGGIYSEKLLKGKAKDSLHWQNMQLYTWGVIFNGGTLLYSQGGMLMADGVPGMLHGYNGWTWAVVLNNALNGLAISAILKYADNIARVYAHACAMLLTLVASARFLGTPIHVETVLAMAIVSASALQYNVKPEQIGFEVRKSEIALPSPASTGSTAATSTASEYKPLVKSDEDPLAEAADAALDDKI